MLKLSDIEVGQRWQESPRIVNGSPPIKEQNLRVVIVEEVCDTYVVLGGIHWPYCMAGVFLEKYELLNERAEVLWIPPSAALYDKFQLVWCENCALCDECTRQETAWGSYHPDINFDDGVECKAFVGESHIDWDNEMKPIEIPVEMSHYADSAVQISLFENIPHVLKQNQTMFNYAFADKDILSSIILIHLEGEPFDIDVTFSSGKMWKGLPLPRRKFDISPSVDCVEKASSESLPIADASISSVAFDPPFLIGDGKGSKIKERFGSFPNYEELLGMYKNSLLEFHRILTPKGIVAFKCQGFIYSGKQNFTPELVFSMATQIGFYPLDKFYRISNSVITDRRAQKHSRRAVSTWWVFRK